MASNLCNPKMGGLGVSHGKPDAGQVLRRKYTEVGDEAASSGKSLFDCTIPPSTPSDWNPEHGALGKRNRGGGGDSAWIRRKEAKGQTPWTRQLRSNSSGEAGSGGAGRSAGGGEGRGERARRAGSGQIQEGVVGEEAGRGVKGLCGAVVEVVITV